MRYVLEEKAVTFYLNNPKREAEWVSTASFAGTCLSGQEIAPMVDAIVSKYRGMSLASQEISLSFLRVIFAWFMSSGSSWPTTSQAWNVFTLRLFEFYLTDTDYSQAKTSTRIYQWTTSFYAFLINLKNQEVMPVDVVIPVINKKKIQSLANDQPLLGQMGNKLAATTEPVQKLLVDISFGMTDSDYLDAVERKCRHLVNLVKDVCLSHWNGLVKDADVGQQLASQITDTDIDAALAERRYGEMLEHDFFLTPKFIKFASPSHPQGINWALALIRHSLKVSRDIYCVSGDTLRGLPFFNPTTLKDRKLRTYGALDSLTSMSPEQWQELPSYARFHRFAGLLSSVDAVAAFCLLIIEHPQFTPESLRNAVLLNVRGKPRLLLTDKNEQLIFYVDKPRAGRLRSVSLTELAQQIVMDIIRFSAPVRDVLKRAGDKTWRYLFLGVATRKYVPGVLAVLDANTSFMNNPKRGNITLTELYPVLIQSGLEMGRFDYRRLRNTMGIIRWFETGSILEMSRRLGNTRKVALENYLPPALLYAWNSRIIRRFQNTLIVLAVHDEPYLLEVTDFSNIADLQHFIAQLICEYPAKTSLLADEVQRRLRLISQNEFETEISTPSFLNVRLSPTILAYLYAYRDLALGTLSEIELDKVDTLSGLAPRQFIDMAMLLAHAAENQTLHSSLRDRLDVAALIACHGRALILRSQIAAKFAHLALKRDWAEVT